MWDLSALDPLWHLLMKGSTAPAEPVSTHESLQGLLFEQHSGQIDIVNAHAFLVVAGDQPTNSHATLNSKLSHRSFEVHPTHILEVHVNSLWCYFQKLSLKLICIRNRLVVDGMVKAVLLLDKSSLLWATGTPDDLGSLHFRQHSNQTTDGPSSSTHKDSLALLGLQEVNARVGGASRHAQDSDAVGYLVLRKIKLPQSLGHLCRQHLHRDSLQVSSKQVTGGPIGVVGLHDLPRDKHSHRVARSLGTVGTTSLDSDPQIRVRRQAHQFYNDAAIPRQLGHVSWLDFEVLGTGKANVDVLLEHKLVAIGGGLQQPMQIPDVGNHGILIHVGIIVIRVNQLADTKNLLGPVESFLAVGLIVALRVVWTLDRVMAVQHRQKCLAVKPAHAQVHHSVCVLEILVLASVVLGPSQQLFLNLREVIIGIETLRHEKHDGAPD
mmetsp:Transcript_13886/g.33518  ORF Transcript_13886/g.33518 Transcript_13886/m.33518 type:complete len:437 (+) Transcript_13886:186-1496(+)